MKRLFHYVPLLLFVAYGATHLAIINDYGLTWDFHHHFFAGIHRLGIPVTEDIAGNHLPYTQPDPRRTYNLPFGPVMSIPPVASYLFFHKTLRALPADSAYHLPIILWGIAGVAVLYAFMKEALSARILTPGGILHHRSVTAGPAFIAAVFLALTPRYFGDMHNNMKDIPSAVIFAVNMWTLWRLMRYKRALDLLVAVAAFAVAFNVKVNSIYIPVVFAAWLVGLRLTKRYTLDTKHFLYFLLAPLVAFAVWSLFFPDPIGNLLYIPRFFRDNTQNIEVPYFGKWYCSAVNVPWHYPFAYLAITTPLPVLLSFVIGTGIAVYGVIRSFIVYRSSFIAKRLTPFPSLTVNYKLSTLLLLWFFIPLLRYLLPSMGVVDGIRHFEEVLFPLAAIAALGADALLSWVGKIRPVSISRALSASLSVLTVFSLLFTLYSYHPYQVTYFNELVGGTRGAMGTFDLDYWGTSQKAAVEWVNKHAPQNASVHVVMAADVAGRYLRPDLLTQLNKYGYDDSDYVVLLNRQSFLYRYYYSHEYLLHHRPAYTVSVAGAPLTWVYDNRTDNRITRQTPYWQGEDPCIRKYW